MYLGREAAASLSSTCSWAILTSEANRATTGCTRRCPRSCRASSKALCVGLSTSKWRSKGGDVGGGGKEHGCGIDCPLKRIILARVRQKYQKEKAMQRRTADRTSSRDRGSKCKCRWPRLGWAAHLHDATGISVPWRVIADRCWDGGTRRVERVRHGVGKAST